MTRRSRWPQSRADGTCGGAIAEKRDTEYDCCEVEYHDETVLFIPSSVVNGYRRQLLDTLSREREEATGEMGTGAFEPGREVYRECRLAVERGEPSATEFYRGAWCGDG